MWRTERVNDARSQRGFVDLSNLKTVGVYLVIGYSTTVNLQDELSRGSAPQVSLLEDAKKLTTGGLRLDHFRMAGTAEFNSYNHGWVQQCFPGIKTHSVEPWAGRFLSSPLT